MQTTDQDAHKGITALFVRRPVLAFVINTLIVVAGLAAFLGVEIRELPNVDRPVLTITTPYDGASAEAIDRELTARIEGAVARVPGIDSISSNSRFGNSRVVVEFRENVNLDVAASDLRDAIGRIANQLPEQADDPRIVKADDDSQPVVRLAMTSDTMNVEDMTLLVEDQIVDTFASVPGVADVQIFGDREKIFRVDIDQTRLASMGLTVADVRNALSSVALDSPAGSLTSNLQDLVVRTTAVVNTPEAFENIMLNGRTRIGDVATVTLGPDIGQSQMRADGKNGIGMGIIRQAQSNTLEISQGVHEAIETLRPSLPEGVDIFVTSDDAVFINGAITEVQLALAIAAGVVLLIILIFLRDIPATLIPGLSMPVALIGTVAAIYLVGFSLNILTLLALVLAAGLVVDDAIVVLENIVRRRNEGMGARAAAVLGTKEVFFAVVATTATLIAVFIPLSFLPGQAGGLFREFGFVLAISVLLSSVVALSLCPMLASRLLAARDEDLSATRRPSMMERFGGVLRDGYGYGLRWSLDKPIIVIVIALLFSALAAGLFGSIRSELTPTEDRGSAFLRINAPQGVSVDYLAQQMRRIEDVIAPLRESGEIRRTFSLAGMWGSSNQGFMVMTLAPWHERERTQQEILDEITAQVEEIPSIRAFAFQPNSLGIRGAGSGLQFAVVGNNYENLGVVAQSIVDDMQADPRFRQARLSDDTRQGQLAVEVDRERASDLGIDIAGLSEAMQAMLDGREVGEVFIDDRSFEVKMMSTTNPIIDPTNLEDIFIQAQDGRFVPMSTIVAMEERAVAPTLQREQQMRAVSITSALDENFALADAFATAQGIAADHLQPGMRIVPLAETATLGETSGSMAVTFSFALIIILLVLAAQFESFVSALIIMTTVPLGLACAIFALLVTGTSLNVYSQIGLVLMVGLMAKNGILIVEFANQLRDRGLNVRDAIERACEIRLRPVMMTMLCTVMGGLPLVMASGAGAEARIALGWVIVGGLGLATISTLFLTPVAYLLLGRFITPKVEEQARLHRELERATGPNKLAPGE